MNISFKSIDIVYKNAKRRTNNFEIRVREKIEFKEFHRILFR